MIVYAENKEAYFNYEILDKYEAGLVLLGHEVKSVKTGKASIKGSYVVFKESEAFLMGSVISPYQPKNVPEDYNPQRSRKLLLNKKELDYLAGKSKENSFALVPLKLFDKYGRVKLEFGIAKGKKKRDKRESIKKREINKQIERALKRE
ncbi:MAG: SsrA-binding protein [Candidatus Nealsonbacteria bacterium RIFOXYB1_FULL_40_15]|uniref:SsrA-binding protein n=2 Tax=Candidatus Nealsoniibacteriota TaxID=1817911 RepID=A0A1G2EUZ4_9BACT|nr:MAG: SsrA-binding protein [Candidatus Nealsonbacteria bacterium RIFOXYB1_FULL_40_15]OGZ28477.1 MAG: SsrA-binding protein [Candidatus Nealsonbacteria bacterium RIFOXYD1_FULL_39_11]OGZ29088.1 MAG: SsrA-binding protein [Candidatus Nealsonbacteria bacterium RIFOXYC1_FULL_40_7]